LLQSPQFKSREASAMRANPRMKTDAQQRRCAPLFRAAYAQRYAAFTTSPRREPGPRFVVALVDR